MFAVIHLPHFSLQAVLRDEPDLGGQPVALVSDEIVLETNLAAARLDVVPGLTAGQAQARCPCLLTRLRSQGRETNATEILLQVAYHFSARIEDTGPGVCTLDLKGLELADSMARQIWADGILKMLAAFHLEGRVGFAVTPVLAGLAAQSAKPILVVQNPDEFRAQLPVEMLSPPANILKILKIWGIETAGALLALDKACVLERLGEDALELFDSLSTTAVRPLRLVIPTEVFAESITFENEIETLQPLLCILERFLGQLTTRLAATHRVAGELKLELGLTSGGKIQRLFRMPASTNNEKVLLRTLRTYLETLKADSPVTSLSLALTPDKLRGHQFGLFEATLRDPNQFFETFARLRALCSPERAGSPVAEPTHKPDAFRMEIPAFDSPGEETAKTDHGAFASLRRLRPVIPVFIKFDARKPVQIQSLFVSGQIKNTAGPYLSSGEWWDERNWWREEWDVQIHNGVCCRIFRSDKGDFLEGVYD